MKWLQSRFLDTHVACVKYLCSDRIFVGVGNIGEIYDVSRTLLWRGPILNYCRIYGVKVVGSNRLVVFGERFAIETTWSDNFSNLVNKGNEINLLDWIHDLLPYGSEKWVCLLGHNQVVVRCRHTPLKTFYSQEKCILYSGLLIDNKDGVIVFSGTVFQEVIIWTVQIDLHRTQILHRLQGHKGVIFSIFYNPEKRILLSTSDDRTIHVWKLHPVDSKDNLKVDWSQVKITQDLKLFGHLARVWKAVIFRDFIISVGEDSQIFVWDFSGEIIKTWEAHNGANIWSIDVSPEETHFVTGGADSSVMIWPLQKNLNDCHDSCLPISCPNLDSSPANFFRSVHTLEESILLLICDQGGLYVLNVKDRKPLMFHHDSSLRHYSTCDIWQEGRFIVVGNLTGHVHVFKYSADLHVKTVYPRLIVSTKLVEDKIYFLKWIEADRFAFCDGRGVITLCRMIEDEEICISAVGWYLIPPSKQRWPNTIVFYDSFLLCGDRTGSIHAYPKDERNDEKKPILPAFSLEKLHGKNGVSELLVVGQQLWSCGRNGSVNVFVFDTSKTNLQEVCKYQTPMAWVACCFPRPNKEMWVLGFHSTKFVVWSSLRQRELWTRECGGGHRSWTFQILEHEAIFSHIREGQLLLHEVDLASLTTPPLRMALHTREINHCLLFQPWKDVVFMVTASEDITVRINRIYFHDNVFRRETVCILRGHICSIRHLDLRQISSKENHWSGYLVSCGGRGQLKGWNLQCRRMDDRVEVHGVETFSFSFTEKVLVRKPWMCYQPNLDPDTRCMTCSIIEHGQDINIIVGLSDGFLKKLAYNSEKKIKKVLTNELQKNCFLSMIKLHWGSKTYCVTGDTSGLLCVWDTENLYLLSQMKIHQSGINTIDIFETESVIHILTGGDDSCAVLTRLYRNEESLRMDLVNTFKELHASQISGIRFLDTDSFLTVSIDQRICIWEMLEYGSVQLLEAICSPVADVRAIDLTQTSVGTLICVTGEGQQIYLLTDGFLNRRTTCISQLEE